MGPAFGYFPGWLAFALTAFDPSPTSALREQSALNGTAGGGMQRSEAAVQACSLTLRSGPVLRIRSPDTDQGMFLRVSGGLLLPDSRIAISSSGTHAVMLFDKAGSHVRSFGRRGEGPAEFRALAGMVDLLDHIPFPKQFPTADKLLVSSNGTLWVRKFRFGSFAFDEWMALGAANAPPCAVRFPAGLRVLDISSQQVLAVFTDSDGVEELHVYAFVTGSSSR